MQWIDVKSGQLPKEDICTHIVTDGVFVDVGFWNGNEFVFLGSLSLSSEVTHWMEFPPPPGIGVELAETTSWDEIQIITPPAFPFSDDEKILCDVDEESGERLGSFYSYNQWLQRIKDISGVTPDLLGNSNKDEPDNAMD